LAISRWLSDKADESDDDEGSQKRGMLILPGILITLLAYYACLETLGFVLSSTGALIILLLLAGERKPIPLILIPLLLPLGLHLFFTHLANIPIPAGPLQSLIGGA